MLPETITIVVAAPTVAVAVKVIGLPLNPVDVAVTVYVPGLFPSVREVEHCPLLPVVAAVALNDCPVAPIGADAIAKLTVTPEIGLSPASVTLTTNGLERPVLVSDDWLFPDTIAIVVAAPTVAVAVKVTGLPLKPLDVAVTVYIPALSPSLKLVEASPLVLVGHVVVPRDCPVAPGGAEAIAKLTVAPDTGLPPASVTVTIRGSERAVLIAPDWLLPLVSAMVVAAPTVAVAVKVTGLPLKPPDAAVTVYVPALFPNVSTLEACPLLLVVLVAVLNDCPVAPAGTEEIAKLIFTPEIGLPPASVTITTSGLERAVLITAD